MLPRFKAIDNETGVILRVLSIDLEFDYIIGLPFEKEARDTFGELIIEKRYYFEDIELLQSTGLLDKNGTEIFEGDILHHKVQGTGVVFYPYRDTMASFGIRNVNTNFGRNLQDTAKAGYEVIGNKFEHPHLLGED